MRPGVTPIHVLGVLAFVHQHDVAASLAVVVAVERTGTAAQIPADEFMDCVSHILFRWLCRYSGISDPQSLQWIFALSGWPRQIRSSSLEPQTMQTPNNSLMPTPVGVFSGFVALLVRRGIAQSFG